MGYETKLFLGELGHDNKENGRKWFEVVAEINLCKAGDDVSDLIKVPGVPIYLYGLDGNHQFTEDFHGESLHAIPATIALKTIQEANKKEKYRRFYMAIPLPKEFIKRFGSKDAMVVVCGY